MIRFSMFGIPIEVQPFFWVICALLGGAIDADSGTAILAVSLFVIAAFISILIHELGHALIGRKLGGGDARIVLGSMGGLAYNEGGKFSREQRFWMIAAGPGAGFIVFLSLVLMLAVTFNFADTLKLTGQVLFNSKTSFSGTALESFLLEKPFVFLLLTHLLWVNFWWGLINLLPVMPLDGGQITDLYVRPQKRVFLIGTVAAALMAMVGFVYFGSIYTALLFGYFAWRNYQSMKEVNWQ